MLGRSVRQTLHEVKRVRQPCRSHMMCPVQVAQELSGLVSPRGGTAMSRTTLLQERRMQTFHDVPGHWQARRPSTHQTGRPREPLRRSLPVPCGQVDSRAAPDRLPTGPTATTEADNPCATETGQIHLLATDSPDPAPIRFRFRFECPGRPPSCIGTASSPGLSSPEPHSPPPRSLLRPATARRGRRGQFDPVRGAREPVAPGAESWHIAARGRIAQLAEQLTLNQRVLGSSPSAPTNLLKGLDGNI